VQHPLVAKRAGGGAVTLEWTGERLVPGLSGTPLYYEHAHRYAYAARFASGRAALDVGSGEGYGAAMLARVAPRVVGLDIAPEAVGHARKTYGDLPNLRFGVADAERLPVPPESVGLVTCFEVVEHVPHPMMLLDEVQRVLRPDGVFIVSTPDKAAYAASRHDEPNEFHLSEMDLQEFEDALARRFGTVAIMGQRLVGSSVMWPLTTDRAAEGPAEVVTASGRGEPMTMTLRDAVPVLYAVAVCTNHPDGLPPVQASFFVDLDTPLFDETYERMEDAQRQLGAVGSEAERLQGELMASRVEVESQRRLAEAYRQEAELIRLELEAERSSTGGALLARYRAAIERLAPTGSLRRRTYLLGPRTVRAVYRRVRHRAPAARGGTESLADAS
jgi:SAM-dependent methyltransferase